MELLDQVKSFVIGLAFPAVLLCLAVLYLTGQGDLWSPRLGEAMTAAQGFGDGLFFLGFAVCTHAWFFRVYDNHPALRYALCSLGVISVIVGFYLSVR